HGRERPLSARGLCACWEGCWPTHNRAWSSARPPHRVHSALASASRAEPIDLTCSEKFYWFRPTAYRPGRSAGSVKGECHSCPDSPRRRQTLNSLLNLTKPRSCLIGIEVDGGNGSRLNSQRIASFVLDPQERRSKDLFRKRSGVAS